MINLAQSLGYFAGTRTGTLTRRGYIRLFTQMFGTPNYGDTEAFALNPKRLSYQATMGAGGSGNSYTETDLWVGCALCVFWGQSSWKPAQFILA